MPANYIEGQDEQIGFDLDATFAGGQVSRLRANLLQPGQYAFGLNGDLDRFGNFSTRRGSVRIGDALPAGVRGLSYMDTPALEYLYAAANGVLYRSGGGAWSSVSGYTPSASARVEMAQLVDRLFFTDGVGNVHSTDGTTVTDEGAGATDPPKCSILVSHTARLFANNVAVPDEVLASDLLDGQTWDKTSFSLRVGGGDGDPITALCPWQEYYLVVGKQSSIYIIVADPAESSAANWAVQKVDANVGCVAHRTMVPFGKDVWFLSRFGVHSIQRLDQGQGQQVRDPISAPIQDWIERINWDAADTACATVWNNRYILAVPLDQDTEPNHLLIYNSLNGTWSGVWTGWQPNVFARSYFNGAQRLNWGREDGRVMQSLDYVPEQSETEASFQDDGVAVPTELVTRAYIHGDIFSTKIGRAVELEFVKSRALADISIIRDGGTDQVIASSVTTGAAGITFPVTFPLTFPKVRPEKRAATIRGKGRFSEVQVKVASAAGKLQVRRVTVSAYPQAYRPEGGGV